MFKLTQKEILELKFWLVEDIEPEQRRLRDYLRAFGISVMAADKAKIWDTGASFQQARILEVGTGPRWGMLPFFSDELTRVGCDPLYPVFEAAGILDLENRNGIQMVSEPFEYWDTDDEQFDAILTANALDHGEMGFYLIPKLWRLLKHGGRLYVHAHLRPPELRNLLHDHCLTEEQLDKHLGYTDLVEVSRKIFANDVDGAFCRTIVGVWGKP